MRLAFKLFEWGSMFFGQLLDETFLMTFFSVYVLWGLSFVADGNTNCCVGFKHFQPIVSQKLLLQSRVICSNLYADLYSVKDWRGPLCISLNLFLCVAFFFLKYSSLLTLAFWSLTFVSLTQLDLWALIWDPPCVLWLKTLGAIIGSPHLFLSSQEW